MLRLNEVKLPLEHDEAALTGAVLARLGIGADALLGYTVFKRSYDARKRSAVVLIYSLDVAVADEPALLARLKHDAHLMPAGGRERRGEGPERPARGRQDPEVRANRWSSRCYLQARHRMHRRRACRTAG